MACTDEVPMGATEKCTLKPFTATKSADARKTVAGSSYVEAGLQPSEGADTASSVPAVIDETLHEAKLPAAVPAGRRHRLPEDETMLIIALKPGPPLPSADYLDELTDTFSPEYIKERKRQLKDEEERYKKMQEESEVFRQQVIKSVCEHGYFAVDDEFLINREKLNQWSLEQCAKKDFGRLRFATDEEEAEEAAALDLLMSSDDE
ncbi:unnamed protein product [Alopecurus aequalis]